MATKVGFEYKDWEWNSVGKIDLSSAVFDGPLRKDIIARVIRWQQAKSRAGTHSTKTIAMVSGTTRKPWAQKETGRARQGSLRAPHFRGGGVVFGPHPRDYEHKLNKKVRSLAFVSSLTFKLKEGLFNIVESLDMPFEKTSAFSAWMKNRGFKSVLFVVGQNRKDEEFRCLQNVPYCDVLPVEGLNVLDIVKHKNIICDLDALKEIEARFGSRTVKSVGKAASVKEVSLKAEKTSSSEAKPAKAVATKSAEEKVVSKAPAKKAAEPKTAAKTAKSSAAKPKAKKDDGAAK